jgi:hypothetical protein
MHMTMEVRAAWLALFLMLAAVGFTILAVPQLVFATRSRDWPPVGATVASVEERVVGRKRRREIVVKYDYTINAEVYSSTQYSTFGPYVSRSLRSILPGQSIVVYVDPAKPSSALIRRGWSLQHCVLCIANLFLWFLAVAFFRQLRPIKRR